MDISVLGVDLGKTVCSVVGAGCVWRGCDASQGEAGDADCSGGEACSVLVGVEAAAGLSSAACSPPTATMSG